MSALTTWFKCLIQKQAVKKALWTGVSSRVRSFADKPDHTSKQIMVQGSDSEPWLRVRRARPADTPRALRFVREHARAAWPGLAGPPAHAHLALCDLVARTLAQGHSMVAEMSEARRGRGAGAVRGLALGAALCAWDARALEQWARCVRCARGRRLLAFTAHCLRAPGLHRKYQVHSMLQVILIVPPDKKNREVVDLLAKNAIQRGKEIGFPLIRFDITNDAMAKTLEDLDLKKEWQLSYDVLPENEHEDISEERPSAEAAAPAYKHRIAVYTALTKPSKT